MKNENVTRRSSSLSILAGLIGIGVTGVAMAQSLDLGPNGFGIRPPETVPDETLPPPRRYGPDAEDEISENDALSIAREEGVRRIDRVREARRGWVIVGIDRNGDDIRILINRRGDVVFVERE